MAEGHRTSASLVRKTCSFYPRGPCLHHTCPSSLPCRYTVDVPTNHRTKRQSHYFTVNLLYFFWSNSADNTVSFLGRVCLTPFPQLNSWCLLRCGSPWARRGSEPAHRGLNWALEEGAWEGHQRRKISKGRMKLCSLEGQDMNTYNHIIASPSLLSFANFQTCNTPCGANWGSPANSLKHQ